MEQVKVEDHIPELKAKINEAMMMALVDDRRNSAPHQTELWREY